MVQERKARRLVVGDRVAVVAPAGPLDPDRLGYGLRVLRSWGLEPTVMPAALSRHDVYDYLAGADEARAKDFRDAWLDPSVAAVLCGRGGYGVQRMVDLLDFDELAQVPPKILLGFSDITALHEPLNARGIVTFLGPMAASVQIANPINAERVRRLLFDPESVTDLLSVPEAAEIEKRLRTLAPGRAEGALRGGNVALLAASIGTPTYDRPDGAIVVLEDVSEDLYRIDRLVTQLRRAGWFENVAGIVLGDFGQDEELTHHLMVDRLGDLGVPVLAGAAFGHEDVNLTVPTGAAAVLDADAKTLTLKGIPLL